MCNDLDDMLYGVVVRIEDGEGTGPDAWEWWKKETASSANEPRIVLTTIVLKNGSIPGGRLCTGGSLLLLEFLETPVSAFDRSTVLSIIVPQAAPAAPAPATPAPPTAADSAAAARAFCSLTVRCCAWYFLFAALRVLPCLPAFSLFP